MSILSDAYAQVTSSAPGGEPSTLANLLPLVLIFAVFYVFLIRPQQKKLKEHASLISAIKRGDEVLTGGGIIGKISKIEENSPIAFVEISDGVVVRVNKATIVEVVSAPLAAPANDEKSSAGSSRKKKNKAA